MSQCGLVAPQWPQEYFIGEVVEEGSGNPCDYGVSSSEGSQKGCEDFVEICGAEGFGDNDNDAQSVVDGEDSEDGEGGKVD